MALRSGNQTTGSVDVIVIGAGQSGLAMSRFLSERSIEHLVLERGEVANSWRSERWDSLKMLTPNWQASLPGYAYAGPEPDAYMSMPEVARFIDGYAGFIRAPVRTGVEVRSVEPVDGGYRVSTNCGQWTARAVVVASGAFNLASVPRASEQVPSAVHQLTARDYRNPEQLPEGDVLVVGGSATGLQLADEIHASGRPVTLAVGEHVRMPRVYRGQDIQYWMHTTGLLDERYDEVDDIVRARNVPSPQLIGSEGRETLDLNALVKNGVELRGRLAGVRESRLMFSGSLRNVCTLADLKMNRMLNSIDEWIDANAAADNRHPAERFDETVVNSSGSQCIDLNSKQVATIVWATGFRPDYSWLDVPVFDARGRLKHDGGVIDAPGLYVLGLPFLRRRKSSFIHGAEDDARDLSEHLSGYLDSLARPGYFKQAI